VSFLQTALGSNLGQVFKDVVGEFHLDAADKAKFQQALADNSKEIELAQIELEAKAQDELAREVEAASANIRAEASSGDNFTRRARPSYIYVVEVILLINYAVFPAIGKAPVSFPDALFWLFGSCVLGYTGARSWDKFQKWSTANGTK
jgi:hypothetical protein